jgi:hypothetical protein
MERYRVVRVHLPTSYPLQGVWRRLLAWLQRAPDERQLFFPANDNYFSRWLSGSPPDRT